MSNVIDLSQTPPPDVVETIDYEAILAERKAHLVSLYPAAEQSAVAAQLEIESDPRTKLLQESSYRETLLRQRVNEAGLATMLPFARRKDLDARATSYDVERLTITPADPDANPPRDAVYESDDDLRRRCLLALLGLSVAGPTDRYIYQALSADGRVLDATAAAPIFTAPRWIDETHIEIEVVDAAGLDHPAPNSVVVTVLARDGVGVPSADLLTTVQAAVAHDDVRPLTDAPVARPAEIIEYAIDATLYIYDGPDADIVQQAARAAAERYATDNHRLGRDITLSGIYAALHQPGVQRVALHAPTDTLTISPRQAAYCTGIMIAFGGIDE